MENLLKILTDIQKECAPPGEKSNKKISVKEESLNTKVIKLCTELREKKSQWLLLTDNITTTNNITVIKDKIRYRSIIKILCAQLKSKTKEYTDEERSIIENNLNECKRLLGENIITQNEVDGLPTLTKVDLSTVDSKLQENDTAIDNYLENISNNLNSIKNNALSLGHEIELQEIIIKESEQKVEKVELLQNNLNHRLKNVISTKLPADKMIIYIILIIVILALISYFYTLIY